MIRIPYAFLPTRILKSLSYPLLNFASSISRSYPSLKTNLIRAKMESDDREYLSLCLASTIIFFFISAFFFMAALKSFHLSSYYVLGPIIASLFSLFIFFQQIIYPGVIVNKKIRSIERNLFPALQSILVQINSGVPLFNVMVNISKSDNSEGD